MPQSDWIDASDTFTRWLCFANPGMLQRGNLACFERAVREMPAGGAMVEIGSFAGLSANLLVYYRRKLGRAEPFFTCDRWIFEGAKPGQTVGESPVTFDAYREFVRESFLRNVQFFSGDALPHTVEMTSDEFFAAWSSGHQAVDVFGRQVALGGPIGFAYIDGGHTYARARADFDMVDRHLMPGGFVLFDDSADGSGWEVCRVVAEVARDPRYTLILKNPNYLFAKST